MKKNVLKPASDEHRSDYDREVTMTDNFEDWVIQCISCIHCYRKKNDADYLYCRLKDYCRYETKKRKNNTKAKEIKMTGDKIK